MLVPLTKSPESENKQKESLVLQMITPLVGTVRCQRRRSVVLVHFDSVGSLEEALARLELEALFRGNG